MFVGVKIMIEVPCRRRLDSWVPLFQRCKTMGDSFLMAAPLTNWGPVFSGINIDIKSHS